jgi:hemin uptake protein HemP
MDSVPASEERIHDATGRPTVRSSDLFQGGKEIVIRHGSEEYRLRITRAGKLILTK